MTHAKDQQFDHWIGKLDSEAHYVPSGSLGSRVRKIAERRAARKQIALFTFTAILLMAGWWSANRATPSIALLPPIAPSITGTPQDLQKELNELQAEFAQIQRALAQYESSGRSIQQKIERNQMRLDQRARATVDRQNRSAYAWLLAIHQRWQSEPGEHAQSDLQLLIETYPHTFAAARAQHLIQQPN